jgi:prepilin-type N-terminal cleavage/methylation domain-containing protein
VRKPRCGFTVAEVLVVSGVMSILAMIISSAWVGVGRPVADMIARCRLAEEIDLATISLARDLGGCLANNEGRLGSKGHLRFTGWLQPEPAQLWLCFDGGSGSLGVPDTVISYMVDNNRLVRWDQSSNTTFTVAQNVDGIEVTTTDDVLQIHLTFSYRNLTRSCTFVARAP